MKNKSTIYSNLKILRYLFIGLFVYWIIFTPKADAAFGCQVLYGGGEMCQGQSSTIKTYPPNPTPIQSGPTPTPITTSGYESVPPTTSLPSTGTAGWSFAILGVAGIAGVLLLLL